MNIKLKPCATQRTKNEIQNHGSEVLVALQPRYFQTPGPLNGKVCILLSFKDGYLAWIPSEEIELHG